MLRDKESNRIQLVDEPNGHMLILKFWAGEDIFLLPRTGEKNMEET